MDINTLRNMRNNDFGQITSAFDKIANPSAEKKSYKDDRFWRLEGDKAGNGTATIRFLPRVEGDELPWVRLFSHGFQGPTGKWYIENSLTTIGKDDPVADFKMRMRKVSGYANYDESMFMEPRPLGEDEKIVKVAGQQYKLSEFTDPSNFKSYDELKQKLDSVLSGETYASKSAAEIADEVEPAPVKAAPEPVSAPAPQPSAVSAPIDDDDDDVMSYFEKIANED
jgi:hypothetical protein